MKPGDKVKIVANNSMHGFEIGDIVTLCKVDKVEVNGGSLRHIFMAQKGTEKFYIAKSDFNEKDS